MKSNRILVVVALPQEISKSKWGDRPTLIYTGIGKINTCIALIAAINTYKPNMIINLGSAGAINHRLSGVVEVNQVIERDIDLSPLAVRGEIPYEQTKNRFMSKFKGVKCASGDTFVTNRDSWLIENNVDIVDMELVAIAKICHKKGISWRSFKYITDYVGNNNTLQWQLRLKIMSKYLIEKFDSVDR